MKTEKINKLKRELSHEYALIKLTGLLGTGNHGIAFALPDDKVL